MRCARVRRELPLLGRGELDPRLEAALCLHLEACAACAAFEAEERGLDAFLAQWRTVGPGRDISGQVLPRPEETARIASRRRALPFRRALGPLVAAAAVLAALALLPFLGRNRATRSREGLTLASAGFDPGSVPIGTGLTGLALPSRSPFRP